METTVEQLEAQENFKNAFKDFAHVVASSFGYFMENVEDRVKTSVKNVSSEALAGVRDLKQEFNIAELVRHDPMPWLAGAAAVGGISVLAFKMLAKGAPNIRWMFLLGELGLSLIAQSRKAQETRQFDYFGG